MTCDKECCDDRSVPYQTFNVELSRKKQGKQNRVFQRRWFSDHKWLSYCLTHNAVFCFYCRKVTSQGGITFSKRGDSTFITTGFSNWKKGKEKFRDHELSQVHNEAVLKHESSTRPGVLEIANNALKKDQKERREKLMKQLQSLRFLLRQGLAVRGHSDTDEGNLYQLMKLQAVGSSQLQTWLNDKKYQSPEIVNEQIQLMSKQVLRSLLINIKEQPFYGIIADETTDISGKEQLAISLRWVTSSYEIHEDLIGLVYVETTDACTLKTVIQDSLIRCGISLSSCRGQAYDGAANMAGHLRGVAARIQAEEPKALFVHCLAHSVNLCLQECGRQSKVIRDGLSLVNEICNFIKSSPKRLSLFERMKIESGMSSSLPSLKPLCPTRWTVRTGAVLSVLKNYAIVQEELEHLGQGSGDSSAKATGLSINMEQFQSFFGLKLSYMVFVAVEQLATTLQSKSITANLCSQSGQAATQFLERQRSVESFENFYENVLADSKDVTNEPKLPRKKRIPHRIDEGSIGHQPQTPKEYFKQQYFEALDILINELRRRFQQGSLSVLHEIEQIIIKSCNGIVAKPSDEIIAKYKSDINFKKLLPQLAMMPELLKAANQENSTKIKEVTSIGTVCDMMNDTSIGKVMFSEVHQLIRLYLTVPMTSATAERTFSALRRLKNYLRSTMTQERLNHVMLLHTHKDKTDELELTQIAKDFISFNERRTGFFGHF